MNIQKARLKAEAYVRRGDFDSAEQIYSSILTAFPRNQRIAQEIKVLEELRDNPPKSEIEDLRRKLAEGQLETVIRTCHQKIKTYPKSAQLWSLTGDAAVALKQFDVAIEVFKCAIQAAPSAALWSKLAKTYDAAGEVKAAAACFEKLVSSFPDKTEFYLDAGRAFVLANSIAPALSILKKYTKLYGRDGEGWLLLGEAYLRQGNPKPAVSAFQNATRIMPNNSDAFNNYGVALQGAGQIDEAIKATQRSLDIRPDWPGTLQNLGNQLSLSGRVDEAIASYARAVSLEPKLNSVRAQKLHLQAKQSDWSAYDEFEEYAPHLGTSEVPVPPFALLTFEDHPERQARRSSLYARKWQTRNRDFPILQNAKPRIAYVSNDVYDHATLNLMSGLFVAHNVEAFDIYIYALNPPRESVLAEKLKTSVTMFRDLHDRTDSEISEQARVDQIDIAIDLKGYTKDARTALFMNGLAPIQVNYLGYPGTMGTDAIDYIVADSIIIPTEHRADYQEAVVSLPHCYQPNDRFRAMAQIVDRRSDHGLPEDATVLCCFNESYKISPHEFDIWMRIMCSHPNTVLWLIENSQSSQAALQAAAKRRGVSADRLVFAPRKPQAVHLARIQHADLFLDTFNYNAHTTGSDALWMGVPLVTKLGQQFAARVGASLLKAVDLEELITLDETAYEAKILELLDTPNSIKDLRSKLLDSQLSVPLFDTVRYTRNLERAYIHMLQNAVNGQSPQDIEVSEEDAATLGRRLIRTK